MPNVRKLKIDKIILGERRRRLVQKKVDEIAENMKKIGQLTRIGVHAANLERVKTAIILMLARRAGLPEAKGIKGLGCQTSIAAHFDNKALSAPLANPRRPPPGHENGSLGTAATVTGRNSKVLCDEQLKAIEKLSRTLIPSRQ